MQPPPLPPAPPGDYSPPPPTREALTRHLPRGIILPFTFTIVTLALLAAVVLIFAVTMWRVCNRRAGVAGAIAKKSLDARMTRNADSSGSAQEAMQSPIRLKKINGLMDSGGSGKSDSKRESSRRSSRDSPGSDSKRESSRRSSRDSPGSDSKQESATSETLQGPDGKLTLEEMVNAPAKQLFGVSVKKVNAKLNQKFVTVANVMRELWEDITFVERVVSDSGEKTGSLAILSYRVAVGRDHVEGEGFETADGKWISFTISAAAFVSAFRSAELAGIDYIWFNCAPLPAINGGYWARQ